MIFNLHICPLLENQHLNLFRFNFDCLVFCFPGQPSVCVLPKKNYNYIRCGNLITLELIQLQFLIKHEKFKSSKSSQRGIANSTLNPPTLTLKKSSVRSKGVSLLTFRKIELRINRVPLWDFISQIFYPWKFSSSTMVVFSFPTLENVNIYVIYLWLETPHTKHACLH